MKKNKTGSDKLPSHFKNFECTKPGEGVCPICHKCGKVAHLAWVREDKNLLIWWCAHGTNISERFEQKLYDKDDNK